MRCLVVWCFMLRVNYVFRSTISIKFAIFVHRFSWNRCCCYTWLVHRMLCELFLREINSSHAFSCWFGNGKTFFVLSLHQAAVFLSSEFNFLMLLAFFWYNIFNHCVVCWEEKANAKVHHSMEFVCACVHAEKGRKWM